MDIILFTVVGIALYFVSDWIVQRIEIMRGAPLPNRTIVFFAIILVLALVSFQLIQILLPRP